MLWGKKKPEVTGPAGPVQTPTPPPAARAVRAENATRMPRSGENRPVTVHDLPEMLLTHADVTREQMQRALAIQRRSGEFIGEILVAEGILDENSLVAFLARHCKIPHLSLLDYLIDESLFDLVPHDFCLQHRLVPIDRMGRNLTVAMVNPLDHKTLGSLHERWPDLRIKPILCSARHFDAVARNLLAPGSGQKPRRKLAYTEETELLARSSATRGGKLEAGGSVDLSDMTCDEATRLPAEAPIAAEEELPPSGGFNDEGDVFASPAVGTDSRDRLLNSVFAINSEGFQEESGDGMSHDGSVVVSQITRKMTCAMVQSMRNTYAVLARRVMLFRGLEPGAVARLFARGKTREYDASQIIFHKGELGRCMYVILSGSVDILDGERVLARLERGENFGEMALLSNAARSASAQAVTPTSVLVLDFADITQDPGSITSMQLLLNITVILSSRLRRAQSL